MISFIKNKLIICKNYIQNILVQIFVKASLVKKMIQENSMINFNSLPTLGTCKISYKCYGENFNLFIPFNPTKALDMSRFQVMLSFDNKCMDITQQPGIPYLFSAAEIGGDKYLIIDTAAPDIHKISETIEAPRYLEKFIENIENIDD